MISPRRSSARVQVDRYVGEASLSRSDAVVVEEPLEIRLAIGDVEHQIAVTMRTPGDDFELTVGFLFAEGLLVERADVVDLRYCTDVEPQEYNIVTVQLRENAPFDPAALTRNFYTTSSCGVCGKASLEAIEIQGCTRLTASGPPIQSSVIRALPGALRDEQRVFDRTGGLHAAGLFDSTGDLLVLREDVGRHNAVDKVVGNRFLEDELPLGDSVLTVSSRASFEIMQKALVAGIATVVAVGAPSSLAVDLGTEFGMTLIGFAKADGFNVYTGQERIGP